MPYTACRITRIWKWGFTLQQRVRYGPTFWTLGLQKVTPNNKDEKSKYNVFLVKGFRLLSILCRSYHNRNLEGHRKTVHAVGKGSVL